MAKRLRIRPRLPTSTPDAANVAKVVNASTTRGIDRARGGLDHGNSSIVGRGRGTQMDERERTAELLRRIADRIENARHGRDYENADAEAAFGDAIWAVAQAIRDVLNEEERKDAKR